MHKPETTSGSTQNNPSRTGWGKLFKTTEGVILIIGIMVALAGLVIMGIISFWSPQTSRMMGSLSFFNILFGRAVSMSIGYAANYGHLIVIAVNMWVETVLVLLFYPIFVFSMLKLVVLKKMRRFIERTQKAAERHQIKIRRYGIIGLFVFVWFPFWMTGPVVGSALGYLLGFPAWVTLTIVLAGTYIAMGAWAYIMFGIQERAAEFGSWAPALIVGLILIFVLVGYWLNWHEKKQK